MHITYRELLVASNALRELAGRTMPVPGALATRRLIRQTEAHLADYEEVRQELLRQHATHDEAGRVVQDPQGNAAFPDAAARQAFDAAYADLLDQTVVLEGWLAHLESGGQEKQQYVESVW